MLDRFLLTAILVSWPLSSVAREKPVSEAPGCGQPAPVVQAGPSVGMLLVPEGPFWRGCNPKVDRHCARDEKPGRCVTLSAFEIDRTEVPQQAWAICVASGHCSDTRARASADCAYNPSGTPQRPMVCVDWAEAQTYCQRLGKRLPTEAEWEKAARGVDGRTYPWGNERPDCTRANVVGCTSRLQDVGSSGSESPYGVKDLAGNVWEWVADLYSASYYAQAPAKDPPGPATTPTSDRIGRGGGFEYLPGHTDPATIVRSALRHAIAPHTARVGIGFRCARSVR